ncbi:MAG TPA: hypothetical protein ENL32_02150 [Methanomicrobia archaeon]|nr:hypothetical protein [Methanomicrobia archaeon]
MVKRMPEGKNDGWTTIRVSMAVYNKLNKMGKTEDTFDDVLRRVLRLPQRNWLEANIKELERKIGRQSGEAFENAARRIYSIAEDEIEIKVNEVDSPPTPIEWEESQSRYRPRLSFRAGGVEFAWMSFPQTTSTLYFSWIEEDKVGGGIRWGDESCVAGERSIYPPEHNPEYKEEFEEEIFPKIEKAFYLAKKIADERDKKRELE